MSKSKEYRDPVLVFSGNIFEVGMIRSLLESEDIPCFLKDEFMGTIEPWVVSPGGAGSVKLLVPAEYQERAIEIINDQQEIK